MPRNMVMAMVPMMARVSAAFLACGRRKAGTPFEMASTPVSAVEPEEKARRMTNSPMGPATLASSAAGAIGSADGQPPRHRKSPTPIIVTIDAMKAYVGNANSVPDSRTPRRLARVISRTNPIESSMRNGRSSVTADVKANTPATTETETVRT